MKTAPRGVSLLEGLIAATVLAIGITGTLQGIIVAARQNTIASRMTTLSSLAQDIRLGLVGRSRAALEAGPFATTCRDLSSLSAEERQMLGALDNPGLLSPAPPLASTCAVDLDDWEAQVIPALRLTPRWTPVPDNYRRWLVYAPELDGAATVYIAVSMRNALLPGRRIVHTQFVGLYDAGPNGNNAGVEL